LQPRVARNELPWVTAVRASTTLKGLWPMSVYSGTDGGLPNAAYLVPPQPRWGCVPIPMFTQGSSFLATLGFGPKSLWDFLGHFSATLRLFLDQLAAGAAEQLLDEVGRIDPATEIG